MADKPQITATIQFRGVTIEGMTVEELRELRDVLNQLVGQKEYVPYPQPYPVYPTWPYGTWCITTTSNTLTLDTAKLSNVGAGFMQVVD